MRRWWSKQQQENKQKPLQKSSISEAALLCTFPNEGAKEGYQIKGEQSLWFFDEKKVER
jgi:hypothetical protein